MNNNDTNSNNIILGEPEHLSREDPMYFKESANTLFNFMGEFEYLEKAIMNQELYPRYNVEDVKYLGLSSKETRINNIAMPMLCFCDIKLHQIKAHIRNYGSFGVGINKQWGSQAQGIQPISYINPQSPLRGDLTAALRDVIFNENGDANANGLLTQLKFSKPLYGSMSREEKTTQMNFHDEHEWRFIPKIEENDAFAFLHDGDSDYQRWMTGEGIKNLSDTLMGSTHDYGIQIMPQYINYIFVSNESFVRKIIDDIDRLDIEKADKQLLMTKIVNLERLEGDW